MGMLGVAREVKHAGFVAVKRTRRSLRKAKFDAATVTFRNIERFKPFAYRPDRYRDTFLARSITPTGPSELPERVFVIWAGDNPLTPNRARNLERIRRDIGLPAVLITPDNLGEWLVPGCPLHPAYDHLSLVHKSDYLRGYLMHHHGGGYIDLKAPLDSWAGTFADMTADPDAWVTSYAAEHANWPAKLRGRIGRDILIRYRLVFGNSGFMMRSRTPLTAEWMREMDDRLDRVEGRLVSNPGGVFGGGPGYPLSWNDLLARVLDPLNLKYVDHVRHDERMMLELKDYR